MGWMVMFVFKDIKAGLSPASLNCLIAGGITYSVGAVVYYDKKNQIWACNLASFCYWRKCMQFLFNILSACLIAGGITYSVGAVVYYDKKNQIWACNLASFCYWRKCMQFLFNILSAVILKLRRQDEFLHKTYNKNIRKKYDRTRF